MGGVGMTLDPFGDRYRLWQQARLDSILAHYGTDFWSDKMVLEIGAGHGFFSEQLEALGARTYASDARPEHVQAMRERGIRAFPYDADRDDLPQRWFDVILHMGVLYHLRNPVGSLLAALGNCHHLVLETEVCGSNEPILLAHEESIEGYDQGRYGAAHHPSPSWVELFLKSEGARFEGAPVADTREDHYNTDLNGKNDITPGQRRMWFVTCSF